MSEEIEELREWVERSRPDDVGVVLAGQARAALDEIDRLRARVAELEAEAARDDDLIRAHVRAGKAETDAARREGGEAMRALIIGRLRRGCTGAVLTADDISRLSASVGPLRSYDDDAARASEALAAQSYQRGAESMRERAAGECLALARAAAVCGSDSFHAYAGAAEEIRRLPLDVDAREEPAPLDLRAHLARQIEWSRRTFGPGPRAAGVVDHIRKELREIEAAPYDLEEWIDVAILAFDGAWRAGHSPDEIVAQLAAKQAKNERRQWPDWRGADRSKAIEHVREDAQGGE